MLAKPNFKYAIIQDNKVAQIFTIDEIKEWSENDVEVLELPQDSNVFIGQEYDRVHNKLVELTLDKAKSNLLSNVDFLFAREMEYLKGQIPPQEADTYEAQFKEAQSFKLDSKAQTPLLSQISKERNMPLDTLVDKVISKNLEYKEKQGKLLGYRQKLQKQIESCNSFNDLDSIKYVSPLS